MAITTNYRQCLDCNEGYFLNVELKEIAAGKLPRLYDKCPSCGSKNTKMARLVGKTKKGETV